MKEQEVPDEVRRFILARIHSVPQLEALLLLRAEPARPWSPGVVAARLYVAEAHAAELVAQLEQSGLAVRTEDGSYRYAAAAPELTRVMDMLAQTYSRNLLAVTDLIHARGEKQAQRFADAFRWRKKGP